MNILAALQECRVRLWRHGESGQVTNGWVGLECRFCGSSKPQLGIHLQSGSVHCWRCGSHGLYDTLIAYGVDRKRAAELCSGRERERTPQTAEPPGKLELPAGLGDLQRPHRRYLERRGFCPDELIRLWKLQGIGLSAKLAWRILIPVELNGATVSWTTRAITDAIPGPERYKSARRDQEAVHRRDVLIGEQHCRHGIVVHEGFFDVAATGPGAVATLGTGFSRGQVARIAKYPVRCICFDAEAVAQRRARKLASMLEVFPGQTDVVVLSGKDAAESPKAELRELRRRYLE